MEAFIAKKADAKLAEKQSAKEPCESIRSALCKSGAEVTSACQDSATSATSCESEAGTTFPCQDSTAAGPDAQCVHDQLMLNPLLLPQDDFF